jgi:hypothetical protein
VREVQAAEAVSDELQDSLGVGLVAQCLEHGEGGEQRDEAGDLGAPARDSGVSRRGGEEGDLLVRAFEVGLSERDAAGQRNLPQQRRRGNQ